MLKADDHDAFGEIYRRYASLVISFTAKRLHDLPAAEDIVHEVFVKLWDNLSTFELKVNLSSYLHRDALNRMLNYLKLEDTKEVHLTSLRSFISAGVEGTDHRARAANLEEIIQREIDLLPPKTKEVFELRRRQQLSNREIAETLAISEQTVETHMKKALKHLRTKLGLIVYIFYLLYK
ncbi:RNA polymerase sigma-70 factor [Mucilaginibacter sp.]|uniref:RNA polymerase sigma-70 factor n=1 Tax=Mucilaginibacter sp. TaxID=1882438 RepID=UPI003D0C591C